MLLVHRRKRCLEMHLLGEAQLLRLQVLSATRVFRAVLRVGTVPEVLGASAQRRNHGRVHHQGRVPPQRHICCPLVAAVPKNPGITA